MLQLGDYCRANLRQKNPSFDLAAILPLSKIRNPFIGPLRRLWFMPAISDNLMHDKT